MKKTKYLYLRICSEIFGDDVDFSIYQLKIIEQNKDFIYAKTVKSRNKYSNYTYKLAHSLQVMNDDIPSFPIQIVYDNLDKLNYDIFTSERRTFYKLLLKKSDLWENFFTYIAATSELNAFIKFGASVGFKGLNNENILLSDFLNIDDKERQTFYNLLLNKSKYWKDFIISLIDTPECDAIVKFKHRVGFNDIT